MGDCPPGVDCGSYWLGFGASVIDNVTMGLTGVRGAAASYAGDASSPCWSSFSDSATRTGRALEYEKKAIVSRII